MRGWSKKSIIRARRFINAVFLLALNSISRECILKEDIMLNRSEENLFLNLISLTWTFKALREIECFIQIPCTRNCTISGFIVAIFVGRVVH